MGNTMVADASTEVRETWRNPDDNDVTFRSTVRSIGKREFSLGRNVGADERVGIEEAPAVTAVTVSARFDQFFIDAEQQSLIDAVGDVIAKIVGGLKEVADVGLRNFIRQVEAELDNIFFEVHVRLEVSQTITLSRRAGNGKKDIEPVIRGQVNAGINARSGSPIKWTVALTIAPQRGEVVTRHIDSMTNEHQGILLAATTTTLPPDNDEEIEVKLSIDVTIPSATGIATGSEDPLKDAEDRLKDSGLTDKDGKLMVPGDETKDSFFDRVRSILTGAVEKLARLIRAELASIQVNKVSIGITVESKDRTDAVKKAVLERPSSLVTPTKPAAKAPAETPPQPLPTAPSGDGAGAAMPSEEEALVLFSFGHRAGLLDALALTAAVEGGEASEVAERLAGRELVRESELVALLDKRVGKALERLELVREGKEVALD